MKLFLVLFLSHFLFAQNAEDILKKSDESRSFANESKIHIRLDNFKNGKLDSSEEMDVYSKGKNKSLVLLSDRNDQLVLTVDESMWIYFPRTRKPMRITPFQRLMGQASNGDIARLSYNEDYSATLIREEKVLGKECYVLELIAKSKSSTYRKVHYWISKKKFMPVKADYFMISGKHFKTAIFEDYKNINGKILLGSMRFFRVDQPKNETVMNFLSYSKSTLSNKYFSKNYLRNVKL